MKFKVYGKVIADATFEVEAETGEEALRKAHSGEIVPTRVEDIFALTGKPPKHSLGWEAVAEDGATTRWKP